MYDAGKIGTGLAVFVGLVTLPFWLNAAGGDPSRRPKLEKPARAVSCVEPVAYMRAWHMDLLNRWRNAVVRDAGATYVASDGRRWTMSLTRTCLGQCHENKGKFCDECHGFVGVNPYCFSCHVEPRGGRP